MQTGMTKGINENESDECTRNNIFRIYERHTFLSKWLMSLGIPEKTAIDDACRMEHAVSKKSFLALMMLAENLSNV